MVITFETYKGEEKRLKYTHTNDGGNVKLAGLWEVFFLSSYFHVVVSQYFCNSFTSLTSWRMKFVFKSHVKDEP